MDRHDPGSKKGELPEALIEVFGTTKIFLKTQIADNEREMIKSQPARICLGQKQKGRKLLLQPFEFLSG